MSYEGRYSCSSRARRYCYFIFFIGIILTKKDSKKLILIYSVFFFFFLEEEVEEEPMSEESDVDLDMEGVVEVNFNVFYLIWDSTFRSELKLQEVCGKSFAKSIKEF